MPLPLDDQICFSLYAASMAVTRTYKPMLDEMGITYPQFATLSVLSEPDDGMTVGAIASRLYLESSTITPLVKRLEAAGLVTRQRSLTDERKVQVRLTDAGRNLLAKTDSLGDLLIKRSGLSIDQIDALNRQVQALRAALSSQG